MNKIFFGENLQVLSRLPSGCANLIYMDPPFNTGKTQRRGDICYADVFGDYLNFISNRLRQCRRLLNATGSIFVHLDYREVHYVKVVMDELFGRENFMNEIIWAYDYGGRPKRRWPAKHDNILWYVQDRNSYTFNYEAIDRIPYMAPGLVGPEKAARGKTPTDVFWNTIVPTNGKEKTGYPTQKPLAILKRIVEVHSNAKELVLDPFAGSGTTGEAAGLLGRSFWLIDNSADAVKVMRKRLRSFSPRVLRLKQVSV